MTGFACMEPITNLSTTTLALDIIKMLLQYSFCHTAVLDKDSKFFRVCRKALELLQIDCRVLSSANQIPMLVNCINCVSQQRAPHYVQQTQLYLGGP
jgi:hypothetical protein